MLFVVVYIGEFQHPVSNMHGVAICLKDSRTVLWRGVDATRIVYSVESILFVSFTAGSYCWMTLHCSIEFLFDEMGSRFFTFS